ncbi:salicylyl-CoA 5-hydroxylase [Longimycelium tulufanense]|uniref:Salicylyl-CoA 5-hydroxylase n=1 Tax=Longimycelium tulufanense TaxID=907463 RepID=A0A8J3CC11_9PSEU|nr:FAD-dependent monooxygenase [Longimycelium tulufanense]GGM46651.1 salicylyl-CoA 5-hydroxylase [Longimycelium tulufanense]
MKVTVLGAGPAGLYLGILLKKADPRHEVTILERNAPDATFGWGVVFSEETLGALRDADPQSYLAITDTFARWDTVDIRYQGRLLRSRGHAFSAISRKLLLAILQDRCRELGVALRFGVTLDDPASLAREADLLVGADGVHSVVRRAHADVLVTSVEPQGCKYVWFGTDLLLDAFTFIFRQTEHGLFQVHSYPFDERTSTFIVECPEHTWRRAGLDRMNTQESIAFCEKLFADDLAGHRLLSNRSCWTDFLLVRNQTWHHRNTVLLGDAAHTAHFSVGSGTKLAMEDAIALTNALIREPDPEAALVGYELERQPAVERFQRAAADSAGYFARVEHHVDLEPVQFAFHLLTRSGRVSHANLAVRDPDFVRVLDSWFAGKATGRRAALAPAPLFAPLHIGEARLPNRIARTVDLEDMDSEGKLGADAEQEIAAATRSGAGLLLTGLVAVSLDGRTSPACPTLHDDTQIDRWRSVVDTVHRGGALVGIRLGHAGRRGATRPRAQGVDIPLSSGKWPLVSASAMPYAPFCARPKAADPADMAALRVAFTAAASRARAAGFDLLELDMAQGYLLASFLSPLTNRRTDGYGGALERRLRFPLEVLHDVRVVWPRDRLLSVRLTIADWSLRGLSADEGIVAARAVAAAGADLVHVDAGQSVAEDRPEYGRGFHTVLSARVRSEARVPTLVGGHLTTLDEVNTLVAAGRADLCLLDLAESELEQQIGEAEGARPRRKVPR